MLKLATLGSVVALGLTACQPVAQEAKAAPPLKIYDAKAFFDTTTVSMTYPSTYSFSADGQNLLLATDKSGVFNAVALPVWAVNPLHSPSPPLLPFSPSAISQRTIAFLFPRMAAVTS